MAGPPTPTYFAVVRRKARNQVPSRASQRVASRPIRADVDGSTKNWINAGRCYGCIKMAAMR